MVFLAKGMCSAAMEKNKAKARPVEFQPDQHDPIFYVFSKMTGTTGSFVLDNVPVS